MYFASPSPAVEEAEQRGAGVLEVVFALELATQEEGKSEMYGFEVVGILLLGLTAYQLHKAKNLHETSQRKKKKLLNI